MAADAEALEHYRRAEAAYLKVRRQAEPLHRTSLARKVGAAFYGTGHYALAHEQFRHALLQVGLHYPTSRWGVRRAILKYLLAHFVRRLRQRAGVRVERDLDIELAKEVLRGLSSHVLDGLLLRQGAHAPGQPARASRRRAQLLFGCRSTRAQQSGFGFGEFNALVLRARITLEPTALAQRTDNPSAVAFVRLALGFLDFHDGPSQIKPSPFLAKRRMLIERLAISTEAAAA